MVWIQKNSVLCQEAAKLAQQICVQISTKPLSLAGLNTAMNISCMKKNLFG